MPKHVWGILGSKGAKIWQFPGRFDRITVTIAKDTICLPRGRNNLPNLYTDRSDSIQTISKNIQ